VHHTDRVSWEVRSYRQESGSLEALRHCVVEEEDAALSLGAAGGSAVTGFTETTVVSLITAAEGQDR
jgi:hypothetical protein